MAELLDSHGFDLLALDGRHQLLLRSRLSGGLAPVNDHPTRIFDHPAIRLERFASDFGNSGGNLELSRGEKYCHEAPRN